MHIAELNKEGFHKKIQDVIEIIQKEREEARRTGVFTKKALNLYPKEEVF